MKTSSKLLICALSVYAACASARSSGQTLTATLTEISPGLEVNGTTTDGAYVGNFLSGMMRFQGFDAFCVEPNEGLNYGETLVYQVQDINLLTNYQTVARLVTAWLSSPQTADHAAAIQWAIWEAVSETMSSQTLVDGSVRITLPAGDPVANLANDYLANANTYSPTSLVYLTNTGRQDVVSWNVIPEPGTAALAGLSVLLLLRRRR